MANIQFEKVKGQTPAYVFDLDSLRAHIDNIRNSIAPAGFCYAMKANAFLVGPLKASVDRFEVCSPGEYEICNRLSVDPDRIVVSGVNKTYASMQRIIGLSGGRGIYTIESARHYEILASVCAELSVRIRVILRLTSGNQFGMDRQTLFDTLGRVLSDSNMEFMGIHYYSGTQKKMSKISKELEMLSDFSDEIEAKYGIRPKELEYGPGLMVSYFEGDAEVDCDAVLDELRGMLLNVRGYSHVTIELGRFAAAMCGYYVTEVVDVKSNDGLNICLVDGGIHQLNYYGQLMGMKVPHISVLPDREITEDTYNVYGSLCTVSDIVTKGLRKGAMNVGDLLVFERCGAYSVTEGMSLFLSRSLPRVMFYTAEEGFHTVRDTVETYILNSESEDL